MHLLLFYVGLFLRRLGNYWWHQIAGGTSHFVQLTKTGYHPYRRPPDAFPQFHQELSHQQDRWIKDYSILQHRSNPVSTTEEASKYAQQGYFLPRYWCTRLESRRTPHCLLSTQCTIYATYPLRGLTKRLPHYSAGSFDKTLTVLDPIIYIFKNHYWFIY